MREELRYQLVIVAVATVVCFVGLGATGLWDMDEALYGSCAREMLERGNWVVPWFNGKMFPEKPPLMFWSMIAGYELFGVNEWGARFFSAVFGVGTALATFQLSRILFSPRVGLWAGLISTSTPMDEALLEKVLDGIRRAVLAVHAELPIPELSVA